MIWFTADEHYGHENVITFCNRPFETVEEMDAALIAFHNSEISPLDIIYHIGDFCWRNGAYAKNIIRQLKGNHVFVVGSHDQWIKGHKKEYGYRYLRDITVENQRIVLCHYAMRTWPQSHHGSWQLYGHSHCAIEPVGPQHDVGVDCNNYRPMSFEQIKYIMDQRKGGEDE